MKGIAVGLKGRRYRMNVDLERELARELRKALIDEGALTHALARQVLAEMVASGDAPDAIVAARGLRKVGDEDHAPSRDVLRAGLDYIRQTPEVRDVLLSGGDPLMLDDDYLDWLWTGALYGDDADRLAPWRQLRHDRLEHVGHAGSRLRGAQC